MYKDMDEQLELAVTVIDVVELACVKLCVTLQRYNVDKQYSSYAQVQVFAGKKKNKKFQQIVHVFY